MAGNSHLLKQYLLYLSLMLQNSRFPKLQDDWRGIQGYSGFLNMPSMVFGKSKNQQGEQFPQKNSPLRFDSVPQYFTKSQLALLEAARYSWVLSN